MPSRVMSKRFLAGVALLSVFGPVSAHPQGAAYSFKDWSNASVTDRVRAAPRLPCEAVTSLTTYEFSILSAMTTPGAGSVPQFCRIVGQIPGYDWTTFDFDRDPGRMEGARSILDATNPDLTRFKSRGGKILMYFGWADPALNLLLSASGAL